MDSTQTRNMDSRLSQLSPFMLKTRILEAAEAEVRRTASSVLNTGRGNPNWVCTPPRKAFIALQSFALTECERVKDYAPALGFRPIQTGIAARFEAWLKEHASEAGMAELATAYQFMLMNMAADPDALVMEWVDGVAGQEYPTPPRVLKYTEQAIRAYLDWTLCDNQSPAGTLWDVFPTEGATAGICYAFETLRANLLNPGDHIAMITPIYSPYIGIPDLDEFKWQLLTIPADTRDADGLHTWQCNPTDIGALADTKYKLLVCVNPSNPPSYEIDRPTIESLRNAIAANPQLMILTDDAYGPFVKGHRSLLAEFPANTISICTYSKYFGATGWRMSATAMAPENVFDRRIAALPEAKKVELARRYGSMTLDVTQYKFIDRMCAESRLVTFNHTAGLSCPQQVLMTLMSIFALHDIRHDGCAYHKHVIKMIHSRWQALWQAFGGTLPADPLRADYYTEIDLTVWGRRFYGQEFVDYLQANYEPLDFVFAVASQTGVIVLDGLGFEGPRWSIRISLSNLFADDYAVIGRKVRSVLDHYADLWRQTQKPR